MIRRLVQPGLDLSPEVIELPSQASRHVARVLRLEVGDELLLLDGSGQSALAAIVTASPRRVSVRVLERATVPRPALPPLRLIQALPKGTKMDEIVRRATELGVASIHTAISERSVARPASDKTEHRLERWQRIAAEASRQSARSHVPTIDGVSTLEHALSAAPPDSVCLMLWEGESSRGLASRLASRSLDSGVTLVIGPEGGFSEAETRLAQEAGFELASLGGLVLRVETAAIAACTVAQLYLGGLEPPETDAQ